jgi:receptor protein-tyrosine kinase
VTSLFESGLELAGPDLRAQLAVLRRRWFVVVAVTAVAAGGAAAVTYARTPLHRAETTVLVAQGGTAGSVAFTRTLKDLVRSTIVAQNVIQDLRLQRSPGGLLDRLSVVADPGSAAITIRADDRSPEVAQQIVQETALVFAQLVKQRFAELSPDPAKPAFAGSAVTVFDPAHTLGGQIEPDPPRDIGIGAGLGLLFGLLGAFLRETLDRHLRSRDAAALAFALPVLAMVQAGSGKQRSLEGDVEGLATLRASVQLLALRRPLRTLVVTGAAAGAEPVAGLVAAGLAAAYARAGSRTILVECDVRRPWLGEALGLGAGSPGLTDVIAGAELAGAVRSAPAAGGQVAVLLGGTPGEGAAADILGGAAAATLIDRLAGSYDTVVLAAPALLGGADALELARLADGTLVVGRLRRTTVDEARSVRDLLANVGVEPLGVVLAAGRGRSTPRAGAGRRVRSTRLAGSPRSAAPGSAEEF